MDVWNRKGRHAIIAAVEAACDAVGVDLEAGKIPTRVCSWLSVINLTPFKDFLERQDRHNKSIEEARESFKLKTDRLIEENRSLKRELEELRQKHESRALENKVQTTSGTLRPNQDTTPRLALAELSSNVPPSSRTVTPSDSKENRDREKEFSTLTKQYKLLEKRFAQKQAAGRQVATQRDQWLKYAESLELRVKKLEEKLEARGGTIEPPDASVATASLRPPAWSKSKSPENDGAGINDNSANVPRLAPRSHEDTAETSSDSKRENTILEAATAIRDQRAEVLSRLMDEDPQEETDVPDELPILPRQEPAESVRIKQEPSSDVPVVVSERNLRKRKATDRDHQMQPPIRRIKSEHGVSSDPIVTAENSHFSPQESLDLDSGQIEMPTPRKQRQTDPEGESEDEEPRGPAGFVRHEAPRSPTLGVQRGRIQRSEANSDVGINEETLANRNLYAGVADVAEDGLGAFLPNKKQRVTDGSHHVTPARGRLHGLLNEGVHQSAPALRRPPRQDPDFHDPTPSKRDRRNLGQLGTVEQGNETTTPIRPAPSSKVAQSAPNPRHARVLTGAPKPGPLRSRPVSELRLEDFKINPKSNNGHTHAFNEVVRNKADRAELPGCTDPNCCGRHFGNMAKSELSAGGPAVLTSAAAISLLEDYLGDESYRLGSMSIDEKKQLWLEAKTQDLANRFGRHRHRFARRPSPVGYWNPDFPSTQEIEKTKEEGQKAERKQVEERWREAMRGGGRWLFRDE